jgi:hypothetical protein
MTKIATRTIRVFLSSTFRDFAEERDLLVRKVFPELRRKCRECQVELVEVDLRWGITEKEAQQGKVLPICLAEIDRSRPFFMSFLGERYGWVPDEDQYDPSLLLEQPWLDEHRSGKSVTELEILHGALNNPKMRDRAFFYFRDPKWTKARAKEAGGEVYISQDRSEKTKLDALKDLIRKSGCSVVENYRNPEALAERVKEDLWKLIDEVYPESEVPDELTRERLSHDAYAATRCRLYLGGDSYLATLAEAMKARPFRPMLVTGQSGGGKSALLANWVSRWSPMQKKTAVIVHHLGCGADAADPVRLAERLMREIAHLTGEEFKPEAEPEKQLERIPDWLAIASAWAQRTKSELLIVLDGIDKVSDRQHLRWFPSFLPPRVRLVVSCLDGEVLKKLRCRLPWLELKVKPFTKAEQRKFIEKCLGRYRKKLTPSQTKSLQSHPLSGNPLFLLTVLEELRVFGVHEEVDRRLSMLLSPPPGKPYGKAPTVDDVFGHVLARIEADLGRKSVQAAMEAIWASRNGLHQNELLAIAKVTPARWAGIHIALDESMLESNGKINFGHEYLRKAVEDRYAIDNKKKLRLHRRLAEWFATREVDSRVADELPWQWVQAKCRRKLKSFLMDLQCFHKMISTGNGSIDGGEYWRELGGEYAALGYKGTISQLFRDNISLELDHCVVDFLAFFEQFCWADIGLSISGDFFELISGVAVDSKFYAIASYYRASFLSMCGRDEEAVNVLQSVLDRRRNMVFSAVVCPWLIKCIVLGCDIAARFDDPRYFVGALNALSEYLEEKSSLFTPRLRLGAKFSLAKRCMEDEWKSSLGVDYLESVLSDCVFLLGFLDPLSIEILSYSGFEANYCRYLPGGPDIKDAESKLGQALDNSIKAFGSDSLPSNRVRVRLGRVLGEVEETEVSARKLLYKGLAGLGRKLNSDGIELLMAMKICADFHRICGRARSANKIYSEILGPLSKILPPEHPDLLDVIENCASPTVKPSQHPCLNKL